MADLTSNLRNLATMVDGLVTEGSPSPKGSSHIVKDLLLERDLLTLMDIVKRNGGKNQSSASEIVLGMSPRASIGVQSEVPTPISFVEAIGGLCSGIRGLAQQQKLCFGGEVVSSLAVVHSQVCTATNVEIELPVPADATNPNVRTSLGSASYAPEKDALIWKINLFLVEYMLRAEYTLPSITSEDAAPERKAPIRVKVEIPYFAVSGIQDKGGMDKTKPCVPIRNDKPKPNQTLCSNQVGGFILDVVEHSNLMQDITPYSYASFGPEYAYPQVRIQISTANGYFGTPVGSGKEYVHNHGVFCLFFQGVYNPRMGQHYLQIYGVPSTVNTNIVPYGQMGHPLSGNHGYPTIQGYVTPGRHVLQYGGPLVSGVTTDTIATIQAQYLAGITNTTGKCYNYNNPNTICKDRDQYLNFDTVHPTQAANYVFSLNCFGGTLCSPLNIRTLVGA
ncbi:unnamed protein product [Camellia sinensis]